MVLEARESHFKASTGTWVVNNCMNSKENSKKGRAIEKFEG